MRIILMPVTLGIFACLGLSIVYAETPAICLENALPLETLRNDADQREAFLLQAKACMRERKPLRAVALLSQIIKSDPTDVVAYVSRGSANASAGELGNAISDFSVAIRLDSDPGPSVVRPRYCARQHGPLRECYRRFYRGYQAETRLCLCLLQPRLS